MSKRSYSQAGFDTLVRHTNAKRRRYTGPYNATVINRGALVPRAPRVYRRSQGLGENHYFDATLNNFPCPVQTTSWSATNINPTGFNTLVAPILGDDINNRSGRKIFVKKIRINGILEAAPQVNQSATDAAVYIRMLLYQDMQTNGSQTGVDNLVLSSGAATNATLMHQNTGTLRRFKVWKDKTFIFQNPAIVALTAAGTTAAQQGLTKSFKWNIRPNCYMNFNIVNGGTIADIVDNSFNMIANATSGAIAVNISYKARAVFSP